MSETEGTDGVPFRDEYVNVRGARLHYIDYGGQGETVVALHGFTATAHVFDAIAPVLTPHFRLLAINRGGRGGTDWAPPEKYKRLHNVMELIHYQQAQAVIELIGFLAALKVDRVSLIGTSQGGMIAQAYAFSHPDKVTRLVLNDYLIPPDRRSKLRAAYKGWRLLRRLASAPAEFANLNEAIAWFVAERRWLGRLPPETQASWVKHYLTPTPEGRWRFSCDPAILRFAKRVSFCRRVLWMIRNTHQLFGPDTTSTNWQTMMSRLSMPVLLLRGAYSELIPQKWGERLVESVPTAKCVEVPGVGHAPTLHEPEAQAALRDFFGIAAPAVPRPLTMSI